MPIKKEIIYPIFLECCIHIEDLYWKQIFEDLSYGKCPYGCYINKQYLCCSFKGKEFIYKIENKDPGELYEDVYDLLHRKLGILSEDQRKNKIKSIELQDIDWKTKKWNNIKKKNIKDLIIDNYIISMKKKYKLSDITALELKNTIITGIIFKTITPKEIKYENGIIISISGIDFEKGKVIYEQVLKQYKYQSEKISDKNTKKLLIDNYRNSQVCDDEDIYDDT
jgi:hypothetical protein